MVSKSTLNKKRYYVLDMEPFYTFPQIEPKTAFKNLAERWNYSHSPHFVADAAFGNLDFFKFKIKVPFYGTINCNSNQHQYLWRLLKRNLINNQWKGATFLNNPIIASCFKPIPDKDNITKKKETYMKILTNAFKEKNIPTNTETNSIINNNEDSVSINSDIISPINNNSDDIVFSPIYDNEESVSLNNEVSISLNNNEDSVSINNEVSVSLNSDNIIEPINNETSINNEECTSSTSSSSTTTECILNDKTSTQNNEISNMNVSNIEIIDLNEEPVKKYSEAEIKNKNCGQLKIILKNHNLKISGKKSELISRILSIPKNTPSTNTNLTLEKSDNENNENFPKNTQSDLQIPNYDLNDLKKLSCNELKEILKKHHFKTSGNKDLLINRICNLINPDPNINLNLQNNKHNIDKTAFKGFNKIHQYYKDNFFFVDKFDSFFYKFYGKFKFQHWRIKFSLCLIRVCICNSYTLYDSVISKPYLYFRSELFKKLISYPIQNKKK